MSSKASILKNQCFFKKYFLALETFTSTTLRQSQVFPCFFASPCWQDDAKTRHMKRGVRPSCVMVNKLAFPNANERQKPIETEESSFPPYKKDTKKT